MVIKKQFILGVLIPLLLGGLIYIGFRSDSLVMFSWFETLHIDAITSSFRDFAKSLGMTSLPKWVVFSLPGGLYMMSCVSLMMLIWGNSLNKKSLFWIFLVPILGILSEPLQYHGLLPGTHHIGDYILYIIFIFVPILMYRNTVTQTARINKASLKMYALSSSVVLFYFVLAFGADVVGSPLGQLVEQAVGSHWAGSVLGKVFFFYTVLLFPFPI